MAIFADCHLLTKTLGNYTIAIKLSIFHLITPLRFLETVRTEAFESYQICIMVDN